MWFSWIKGIELQNDEGKEEFYYFIKGKIMKILK